jgi:hypothetical protein
MYVYAREREWEMRGVVYVCVRVCVCVCVVFACVYVPMCVCGPWGTQRGHQQSWVNRPSCS